LSGSVGSVVCVERDSAWGEVKRKRIVCL